MGTLFVQQGNLMDRAMHIPWGDFINVRVPHHLSLLILALLIL
jgi:hypothetical protein